MIQQVLILLALYIIGLLFISLFYPKIPIFVGVTSGLYWGALLYIFVGILLGILGLYSWLVWIVLGFLLAALLIIHFNRKEIWKTAPWKTILISITSLLVLFGLVLIVTSFKHQFLTTSTSLPYLVYGSHIFHYGTILLDGAGYFFRSHYGISEALIHALGGFIDAPALTLWHPFLWISQYAFCAAVFFDLTKNMKINDYKKIVFCMIAVIWAATASLNWLNSFYIHVHLFTSFSVLIFNYLYFKVINSNESSHTLGFLGTLALCGFGLSRVESPIIIIITLFILVFAKKYSRQEIRSIFYPPIILEIVWLTFLFFGYRHSETQYWSDSRLLFALCSYSIFFVLIIFWEKRRIDLKNPIFQKIITISLLTIPFVLWMINSQKLITNISAIFHNTIGELVTPGYSSWNFFWIAVVIIVISLLASIKPWEKTCKLQYKYSYIINFVIAYLITILVLGFIRAVPYSGTRWGDSACRMLSHIAPLISLFIAIVLLDNSYYCQNND